MSGSRMEGGPRKAFSGQPLLAFRFFSKVRAKGLPVTKPSQTTAVAQITAIQRQPNQAQVQLF